MLDATLPFPPDADDPLRAIAFLLPQFHPVAENDVFWGAGFTEWRNVVQARPRFHGHAQPHLPADLGFYDLRLPQTRAAQAEMARRAGLSGFAWYHYWFAGRRLLNQPFDAVLTDPSYDFPFLLCWANENWTRAWDGGAREVLIAQDYSDTDTAAHARHLIPALTDARAIRLGDRPVFAVYAPEALPDPLRWSEVFRETLAVEGIDPYLIAVERWQDCDRRPPAAKGFDAGLDFQPCSRNFMDWLRARPDLKGNMQRRLRHGLARRWRRYMVRDRHHDMAAFVDHDLNVPAPDYPLFPGVCPAWDNSARRPKDQAIIFRNTSPALFARWTAAKAARARATSGGLLFVNAWNEWAEGNHLEPCLRHGHAWLDALRWGLHGAWANAPAPIAAGQIRA